MILLDTDALTHLAYGNANVRRRIDELPDGEELGVTVVTRYELLRGRTESVLKAADANELRRAAERLRWTGELLAGFVIVDFNDASLDFFERLRQRKTLKKVGRADLLIACIALGLDALLVTRNLKDYKDVPGLRTENWVD